MSIQITSFTGREAERFLPDLARLRISVMREFPYLYDGNWQYEEIYLRTFLEADRSVVVIAFDGDQVVGASTALPLEQESEDIRSPWLEVTDDISHLYYLSESVLEKTYRGQGIGKRFFEERARHARDFGYTTTTFCGVIRPEDHPLRPKAFVPLDGFWRSRGYRKKEGVICTISWKQIDEAEESPKQLQFWEKTL